MKSILLTFFADWLFAILVIISAVIMLRFKVRRGEMITRGVLAGICAVIIDKSSGIFFFHERPFVVLGKDAMALNPHNNAFPSDHALIVFTAAFVVWIATKNWKLGLSLVLGGVAVGVARVIALVHWPVDIAGSFVIAGTMVALWFTVPWPRPLRKISDGVEYFIQRKLPKWLTGR